MGGGTLLFNPSHGIRFRVHPTSPLRLRTGHYSCSTYRRVIEIDRCSQRCLAIRSEANKGAQSRRNSKSNSVPSSKLISKTTINEASSQRGDLSSLLKKIDESIKKGSAVAETKEISFGDPQKQSLQPKSKEEKLIDGQKKSAGPPTFDKLRRDDGNKVDAPPRDAMKSTGYETTFAILCRDDKKKAVVLPRFDKISSGLRSNFNKLKRDNGNNAVAHPHFDLKSSGHLSNFDKLIRDNSDSVVALPPDYKPPRPTSRFVRRSPIPISDPEKEKNNSIPRKQPPSFSRAPFKQEMSVSDQLQAIVGKKEFPPKLENLNLREILKLNTTPKYTEIPKALTELKPKLELEATTIPELRDIPKTKPELVSNSELEVMTAKELKIIAKARGLKGYTKMIKAELLEILKGTSS